MESEADPRVLTMTTLNPNLVNFMSILSNHTLNRATQLRENKNLLKDKSFRQVVDCSIGDCHEGGQKPITFIRQVLALCSYPQLGELADFPADVKSRAERILGYCKGGSIGCYSKPWGIQEVREDVASFISKRDGCPSNFQDIFLSSGASESVQEIILLLLAGRDTANRAGFLIPVPLYLLYSAAIEKVGACMIPYYLEEGNRWYLDTKELERALAEASSDCIPRALVVINPGNPAGHVLSKENIVEIIKFAYRHRLFLMADEVYQQNIWAEGLEFVSFKKTLMEMGAPYNQMQLASFMTVSKGFMGECGLRAGYVEVINLPPEVKGQYMRTQYIKLCAPVTGQAVLDCVVDPPKSGDPSFHKFEEEKSFVLKTLKEKVQLLTKFFDATEGISCAEIEGSMYAFPRLHLPQKAIQAAEDAGLSPDDFYCLALLEEAGVYTLPGICFGQRPGTYHLRMTIMPKMEDLVPALERFKVFHQNFLMKYK